MNIPDDDCKKIAQAIALNMKAAMRLYSETDDATVRTGCDLSLQAGGWALVQLGECLPGDDLASVVQRLIDRHNSNVHRRQN